MEFQGIIHRAMSPRKQYGAKETSLYGSASTSMDIAQGFAGDANNLVKLMEAEAGQRQIANC